MPYPRYAALAEKYKDDPLFEQLLLGIVGGGTNEPQSVERALAFGEGAQTSVGDIGSEFTAALGGSRKMRKGEQMPSGAYSLAKFPGIEHQIWAAESGFLPRGYHWSSLLNESPDDKGRREQDQRKFAAYQKKLLGMDMAPQRGWRYRR